jgi:putative flippase GtrA
MQFFLYLIVGGLSFIVDIGTFVGLRAIEVPVMPASVTSFILATVANYFLSVVLAFERGRFGRQIELLRFLAVVIIGLSLNTLLVWCFVYPLSIHPTAAKIIAVPIVLIWNYLGRRLLVFGDEIPIAVRTWLKTGRGSQTTETSVAVVQANSGSTGFNTLLDGPHAEAEGLRRNRMRSI